MGYRRAAVCRGTGRAGLALCRGSASPIDSLIALATLREMKRLTTEALAKRIERDATQAKRTLEALVEAGLVQAHGATRGRTYTLAPGLYLAAGDKAAYTRQIGFSSLQHEQMVLNFARQHGRIRRADVMDLCMLSEGQAKDLLKRLKAEGRLILEGAGRGATYRPGEPPEQT